MVAKSQMEMVPVPDPTELTTTAVNAAKADIRYELDTKLSGFRELVMEMISGRDRALDAALKAADELNQQQNENSAKAADKADAATTKQIDALILRIDDFKDRVSGLERELKDRIADLARKDWSSVGGYIFGAFGIAALVLAALQYHK